MFALQSSAGRFELSRFAAQPTQERPGLGLGLAWLAGGPGLEAKPSCGADRDHAAGNACTKLLEIGALEAQGAQGTDAGAVRR